MRNVLEAEAPKYPPGRGTGYHTFTYGWLVDQIVRHADEKHRGIGQFFREEIAQPNGKKMLGTATLGWDQLACWQISNACKKTKKKKQMLAYRITGMKRKTEIACFWLLTDPYAEAKPLKYPPFVLISGSEIDFQASVSKLGVLSSFGKWVGLTFLS